MPPENDTATDHASDAAPESGHEPAPVFRPTLPTLPPRQSLATPPPTAGGPGATGDAVANALQIAAAQSARYLPPPTLRAPVKRKKSFLERLFLVWLFRLGLAAVVAAGVAGYRWYQQNHEGPSRPDAWDERVLDHVEFVEKERGLTFEYPIAIDFLPEDEFVAIYATDDITDEDRAEMADALSDSVDLVNAAGLSGSYDPIEDESTMRQVSVLGFYDPSEDRITLRGDELTPAVEAVLVHELTHALQAQHFPDIELGGPDDLQVRAIVEGDAMRIEDAYVETMTDAEREDVYGENYADDESDAALSSVPWPMVDQAQAPYIFGPRFLDHIIETSGATAVNDVFEDIPSSLELLNPSLYGVVADKGVIGAPLPDGAVPVGTAHEWSYYDALLMLDAWLPWRDARGGLEEWRSASITTYRPAGSDDLCFSATVLLTSAGKSIVVGQPVQPTVSFDAAIRAWAVASGSTAEPVQTSMGVWNFNACPRTKGAADPPQPVYGTSEAVLVEDILTDQIVPEGEELNDWGVCIVRALVDDVSLSEVLWLDEVTPEQDAAITLAVDTAKWLCGEPPG